MSGKLAQAFLLELPRAKEQYSVPAEANRGRIKGYCPIRALSMAL